LNKLNPGEPLDKDIYDLSPEEMKAVPSMPGSLDEALDCLEEDHAFLLRGTYSAKSCSRRTSTTSARTKPKPSGCARTRTNSRCTTTFRRQRF